MTCTYVRYNNLKKTGQLRNVRVEFGFGTVCAPWVTFLSIIVYISCMLCVYGRYAGVCAEVKIMDRKLAEPSHQLIDKICDQREGALSTR